MQFLLNHNFIVLIFVCFSILKVEGVKKKIIKEVNICKRNEPELTKCYCTNFNKLIPMLKNGIPEMYPTALDPVMVDQINMDLPETKSVRLSAQLSNVIVKGLSKGRADECEAVMTEDGIQLFFKIYMPEITLSSNYKAKGKFLLVGIDADSDFQGEFSDMYVTTIWNSTRYMRNNKEHLKFTSKITDMQIKKMKIHFNNILGANSTDISDNINESINSNIDLLYEEIKPVILETVNGIALKITNEFYTTFSFDVLYPKD